MEQGLSRIGVTRLGPADVDKAWPLARLAFEGLTLRAWRTRARRWITRPNGPSGVLVARDGGGCIVGLAPFHVQHPLGGRRTLWVEAVVAFGLLGNQDAASALVRELTQVGAALGCDRLEVAASPDDEAVRAAFAQHAPQREAALLRCPV